jgi:Zn finger protein HypA/HybF involved in hydrogenase expression
MDDNSLLDLIQNYVGTSVCITDIHVGLQCYECGHTWGIKLNLTTPLETQAIRFMCAVCQSKKVHETREAKNGYHIRK